MRLIDAEEIEELFHKQVEYGATDLVAAFDDALQDARTVYAAEAIRDQWVSVEDRLPELIPCSAGTAYSEAVVVLTSDKKAMIAIWDGVDFLCAASYWDAEGEQITHWMPLPELPEEDKP